MKKVRKLLLFLLISVIVVSSMNIFVEATNADYQYPLLNAYVGAYVDITDPGWLFPYLINYRVNIYGQDAAAAATVGVVYTVYEDYEDSSNIIAQGTVNYQTPNYTIRVENHEEYGCNDKVILKLEFAGLTKRVTATCWQIISKYYNRFS